MRWATFIHIYQPPTQKELWIRRITDESYRKITNGLLAIPRAKLTLNINGILCELLDQYGGGDVLENIRTLLSRGQIELTGSAKYHAFLPLLPEHEVERQIQLNEASLDRYFGDLWRKNGKAGFFSPEMAYSESVARVAQRAGYKWIISDELAAPRPLANDTLYAIKDVPDFGIFFRERNLSFVILSAEGAGLGSTVFHYLGERTQTDDFAITAMDGETFGHHRPGLEQLLFDLMKDERIEPETLSGLRVLPFKRVEITPRDSTWAATKKDMRDGTPYARWKNNDNPIQTWQWQLTDLAVSVVGRAPEHAETRDLLDQALHSDQYWWSSAKPWWSLEMIERGAFELKTVVTNSPAATADEKEASQKLYSNIIFQAFEWQRNGLVDEISRQEDEEVQERLELKEKMFITKKEYGEMIRVLEDQMHMAAKSEEYHRAGMIKDRIRELSEEQGKARE